jgi:hypothetical protein
MVNRIGSLKYCVHRGMVLMGDPNLEKLMAGMMKKKAVTIACCCVDETVEISRPTPSTHTRKSTELGGNTEA